MSQIPGGRPRASSDGDILDEGLNDTLFGNLNNRNCTEQPRKHIGKTRNAFLNINNSNSINNLNSSDETFDSDSKLSSTSNSQISSRPRRKGLNFKSMRKIVSRVFVKDLKSTDTAVKKSTQAIGLYKFRTPDHRHIEEQISNKSSSTELLQFGALSTARPLITNLNAGRIFPRMKTTPGVVGIYNHGNNCFMNAVLQCLSNTDSFTEYFIRNYFKNDLKNSTNGKRGVFRSSHGEVTEQLGNFLKCLWSGKYSSEISREFKNVVGKFNNQYKGDEQHDAQEFLLWLLDCIHEDVSTFTKKKVKSLKTSLIKTDKELASEAELVNGQSFILKLFQALHSSTLTCPTCGERSSTFDPYLCVSLPLPQRSLRVIYVIVVSLEFQATRLAFTLNQNDEIKELRELVADDARIPLKQLLLIQLKDDCFGATYSDEQPLTDIPESEVVYAIEAHPDSTSMHSPTFQMLVIHVEVKNKSSHCYRFGSPAMIDVRRDITWDSLQMEILKKMEDSVSEEIFSQTEKLSNFFSLRVYDGRSRKFYLPSHVDMPLYSECAERAYSISSEDCGPPHIKVIAEWDSQVKTRVVVDDQEHIENSPSVAKAQNSQLGQGQVSLEECFRLYTQEEKLIGEDAWLCPHCKRQQQGTIKTLRLWSLPEVLVLHLKRFKQTGRRRSKLNTLIDFPVDSLDMSSHLSHRSRSQSLKNDDYIYDLVGVSNHYGNMMGGHYTAYCRNPIDGKWREYNDAKVRTLDGPVVTKEAYILFYQRRSLSKNVNQRLCSGDHWIYSLHIVPLEGSEEKSASDRSNNFKLELCNQSRNSRSRSASPSTHRHNNNSWKSQCIPVQPFTPQPVRHTMKSYTSNMDQDLSDDSTRSSSPQNNSFSQRSRPLRRQSSDSRSQFSPEMSIENSSSVRLKNPSRAHYSRGSPDLDNKDVSDHNALKPKLSSKVTQSKSLVSSRTGDIDKSPSITVSRYDPAKSNDLRVNTSRTTNHYSSVDIGVRDSHAVHPPSPYAVSASQMNQESSTSSNHSSELYNNSPPVSDAENPGRKLAYIIKQDIMSRAHKDTTDVQSNFVRHEFRSMDTKSKPDLARFKQSTDCHDVSTSQVNTNHAHLDNFTSGRKYRDNEFQQNNQSTHSKFGHKDAGYSQSKEDYMTDSVQSQGMSGQSDAGLTLLDETQSHRLKISPEKHFERTFELTGYSKGSHASKFADDTTIWNSEHISPNLKDDVSHLNKWATVSRTYNTSQTDKIARTSIPRSNTDHSIHYSNSSLAPPPSPAPPHSLGEEQKFTDTAVPSSLQSSTSDYLTSGSHRTHSTLSYQLARHHPNDHNGPVSPEFRTLPRNMGGSRGSRYNFHRPRDVVVKPGATPRNLTNISTPCLRESSV